MDSDMPICKALGIVNNIENEMITDREKATAIYLLCVRPEHIKDIQKKEMRGVIIWLWKRCFRIRNGKSSTS